MFPTPLELLEKLQSSSIYYETTTKGMSINDVTIQGRQVGQAKSDFTT